MNTPLSEELCEDLLVRKYGFYRRLNNGKIEFISFCKPESGKFIGVYETDLERFLEASVVER